MNKAEKDWEYKERAVLVGVDLPGDHGEIKEDFERSMEAVSYTHLTLPTKA